MQLASLHRILCDAAPAPDAQTVANSTLTNCNVVTGIAVQDMRRKFSCVSFSLGKRLEPVWRTVGVSSNGSAVAKGTNDVISLHAMVVMVVVVV